MFETVITGYSSTTGMDEADCNEPDLTGKSQKLHITTITYI